MFCDVLFLVSFCRSVPPEFLQSFLLNRPNDFLINHDQVHEQKKMGLSKIYKPDHDLTEELERCQVFRTKNTLSFCKISFFFF